MNGPSSKLELRLKCQMAVKRRSRTSGAMYSGVPQAVLQMEPATSSLLYPKSQILTTGRESRPCSRMLSSLMSRLAMPMRWQ